MSNFGAFASLSTIKESYHGYNGFYVIFTATYVSNHTSIYPVGDWNSGGLRVTPLPSPLPQDPELPEQATLSARARLAAEELIVAGQAANTRRSYASALRYWSAWGLARYGKQLRMPVAWPVVVTFIVDHAERLKDGALVFELPPEVDRALVSARLKGAPGPLKLTTIQHRLAVLSKAHQLRELDNPCDSPKVRELVSSARRAAAKRGVRRSKKTAATREPLEAMLAACDDSLMGLRDRAILLLGWSTGGRRRSEIAGVQVHHLQKAGTQAYWLILGATKTDPFGADDGATRAKPVLGRAALALEAWLAGSGIQEGALFRRVWGPRLGAPLSPAAIAEVVQRRAAQAGIDGDWGGHSLRSGYITEAGRERIPPGDAMALSDHREIKTFMSYYQAGEVLASPAATLLERGLPADRPDSP